MKLKHICYLLPFIILVACKNGDAEKEDTAKQDSIKKAEHIAQIEEAKKKNIYLIEPPDTSYSGDYVDKYENGNTKFKGFFRFGKRHGQWLAFYANGLMWSECYYNKGMRDGANNVFFENGKPRYKGWFKNDMRDSVWVFYDESGAELQRITFKEDQEVKTSK